MPQESPEQDDPGDQRDEHRGTRPAQARLLDQREHRTGQTRRAQQRSGHVDFAGAGLTRCGARHNEQDQPDADDRERDVDYEQPPPRADREQLTAGQRSQHAGNRTPRRPAADRGAALVLRERVHDHRQRARHQQRTRHALQRAHRHEHADRGRERAGQRGEPEARDAEREDPPLAKKIPQRPSHEDQRAERQQIPVHNPLLRGQPPAERALDRRQRDVHDRAVEQHDPRAHDAGDQCQALGACVNRGTHRLHRSC